MDPSAKDDTVAVRYEITAINGPTPKIGEPGCRLFGHEVETSEERGWDTLANGVLLDRAGEAGLEALLTAEQSIRYQQNMTGRQLAVMVLMNTNWPRIARNTEVVREALEGLEPGETREVPIP